MTYNPLHSASISKILLKKFHNSYMFKVSLGHFYFEVTLLKANFDSYIFERKPTFKGTYAEIFICERGGKTFAVKSIKK